MVFLVSDFQLEGLSLERLEAEISRFYWEAAALVPGVSVVESGLLAELWLEFDRRVEAGVVEVL